MFNKTPDSKYRIKESIRRDGKKEYCIEQWTEWGKMWQFYPTYHIMIDMEDAERVLNRIQASEIVKVNYY